MPRLGGEGPVTKPRGDAITLNLAKTKAKKPRKHQTRCDTLQCDAAHRIRFGTNTAGRMFSLWMRRSWLKRLVTRSEGEESNQDRQALLPKTAHDWKTIRRPRNQKVDNRPVRYMSFGIGGAGNIRRCVGCVAIQVFTRHTEHSLISPLILGFPFTTDNILKMYNRRKSISRVD